MHLIRAALSASARTTSSRSTCGAGRVPLSLTRHRLSSLSSVPLGQQQYQHQYQQNVVDSSAATITSTGITSTIALQRGGGGNDYLQHQQLRYRRHDRSSAFSKPRPKTKKQRQAYNRRMKKINDEKEKHNRPGFRAGPQRQFKRERWQQLLEHGEEKEETSLPAVEEEYGMNDFMIEELIGNTSYLTSQPTPEPHYLGHQHDELFHKVATQMDRYRKGIEQQAVDEDDGATTSSSSSDILEIDNAALPSDKAIADVIRAYRDKNGTRRRPIGIVMALQHVLKDLAIPTVAFGEYTYTALLTCCRTPNEARRIFKLMNQNQHPISSYSWSILVDVHSKVGDYEGCANVIKEMAAEGVAPTLPSYTSLLAACYKICNDGRIPHSIRAQAGKVGWEHWQELRIVGMEPDAMAYGAIIRLCAARGRPERAIGLLEDMKRFDVKPTTLCFAGALKAVARSHEISIRFEHGASRKQLRRETFAAHHGKMARKIVIMAENAEVEQDEGFVSALMLCAAAAGDSASAKAIYLAAEVRKMDQLRTVESGLPAASSSPPMEQLESGGGYHDQDVEASASSSAAAGSFEGGEDAVDYDEDGADTTLPATTSSSVEAMSEKSVKKFPVKSFGEREYGKDTRTISAMLRACAQAMGSNGIGTIWEGSQNQGFLCENSQRLITTRWEPRLTTSGMPGESSTKVGIGALKRYDGYEDEESDRKKGSRQKFRGMYIDEDPMTQAELDGTLNNHDDDDDFEMEGIDSEEVLKTNAGTEHVKFESSLDGFVGEGEADMELFDDEIEEEEWDEEDSFDESEEDFELDFEFSEDDEDVIHASTSEEFDGPNSTQIEADSPDFKGVGDLENAIVASAPTGNAAPAAVDHRPRADIDLARYSDREIDMIEQLKVALPGLPMRRIVKIMRVFESNLGAPSMLLLVPLLRETMPDYVGVKWLKKINRQNAEFVLEKALENGTVNRSILDTMLQVKSSSGALDGTIKFYEEQYRKQNMKPNEYGDRLVIELLVANHRLPRAFAIKQKIEESGRKLDLASYGTIIEHYSKRSQIGSALLLLKECISIHGAPPSEKYLKQLRVGCRQMNIESEARLEEMIGQDPIRWLRHGETFLKRERSKKGRRNVQLVGNTLL